MQTAGCRPALPLPGATPQDPGNLQLRAPGPRYRCLAQRPRTRQPCNCGLQPALPLPGGNASGSRQLRIAGCRTALPLPGATPQDPPTLQLRPAGPRYPRLAQRPRIPTTLQLRAAGPRYPRLAQRPRIPTTLQLRAAGPRYPRLGQRPRTANLATAGCRPALPSPGAAPQGPDNLATAGCRPALPLPGATPQDPPTLQLRAAGPRYPCLGQRPRIPATSHCGLQARATLAWGNAPGSRQLRTAGCRPALPLPGATPQDPGNFAPRAAGPRYPCLGQRPRIPAISHRGLQARATLAWRNAPGPAHLATAGCRPALKPHTDNRTVPRHQPPPLSR